VYTLFLKYSQKIFIKNPTVFQAYGNDGLSTNFTVTNHQFP